MKKGILFLLGLEVATMALLVQPTIIQPPTNQVVAVGATLTLNVVANGNNPALLAYQWFKDSRRLVGATNSTLSVTKASMLDSGVYFVVVTNASGMAISYPVRAMVGHPCLLAWGQNNCGQLGNGTNTDYYYPNPAPFTVASNVVTGAEGGMHSLFVMADGTLWTMGHNISGQLGNGTTSDTNLPVNVASNVVAVAAGWGHSLFVKSDGTLWAMGASNSGELGIGTNAGYPFGITTPIFVTNNVVAIAAGMDFSLFVTASGTLWTMGSNTHGQLGLGTVAPFGRNYPTSVASNVVAVAAGNGHSLFVKMDGTLWGMGDNGDCRLGNIANWSDFLTPIVVASNVVAVAAGGSHSLFVKTDGTLWGMGNSTDGEVGCNWANGAVFPPFCVASNVVVAAAGMMHSLFVQTNGMVWAMGGNSYGQLGIGVTNSPYYAPTNAQNLFVATVFQGEYAHHSLALGIIQTPAIFNFFVSRADQQQLTLKLTGTPNYPYSLQMAPSLTPPVDWQSFVTNLTDAYGNWSYTVTNIGDVPGRFYRACGQ
jgi:alpha-tubulin suppressor-like RCC1 family protein